MSTPTPTDPREEKPKTPETDAAAFYVFWDHNSAHWRVLDQGTWDKGKVVPVEISAKFESTSSKLATEIAELKGERDAAKTMCAALRGLLSANGVKVTTPIAQDFVDELDTLRAELEAQKEWRNEAEGKLIECGREIANHVTELEAARKEAKEYRDRLIAYLDSPEGKNFMAAQQRDTANRTLDEVEAELSTALAAKDAAEKENKELREREGQLVIKWEGQQDRANQLESQLATLCAAKAAAEKALQPFAEVGKLMKYGVSKELTIIGKIREQDGIQSDFVHTIPSAAFKAALTPAPTQEPPAGGVTISTVEKERDHWKATAEFHYNARLELERERDRKGGDSSCAPSKEPTHQDSSKCASNSPADVPSEGRGELLPFNLSDALAGKPVVTRYGRKVTEIQRCEYEGWIKGRLENLPWLSMWLDSGRSDTYFETPTDLFMLPTEGSGA